MTFLFIYLQSNRNHQRIGNFSLGHSAHIQRTPFISNIIRIEATVFS